MLQEKDRMDMTFEQATGDTAYEKATAELVYFDNSDVITTSGGGYDPVRCYINIF